LRIIRLAIAVTLVAASSAGAADDDVEFAKALARRGYGDVAERVLRRAAADAKASPSRVAESKLALAQLRRFEATRSARTRGADRAATLRLFEAAESAYRALVSDPSTAKSARLELARLGVAHATFAGGAPEAKSALDESLSLLAHAETAARADADAATEGAPERSIAEDEIASIRLLRVEALHARGAALGASDPAGAAALNSALEEIEKFTWDYAGTLRCAWAFRWRGLVLARLGRTREACESLRDAASAVTERDGVRGVEDATLQAFDDLARTASSAGDADGEALVREMLPALERLPVDWPRHLEFAAGRRARLAAARLHVKVGDKVRAADDARAVLAAAGDDDPDAAEDACAIISDCSASSGGVAGLDPELLSRIVRASANSGDLARTVDACRALISACNTPKTRDQYAWDAWDAMGRAYGGAGKWYEAYLAFDRVERAWRADPSGARLCELVETTAFYRADALTRLAAETKDDADRAAAERAMAEFARDHPGSSLASGARDSAAFRALSEAAALRRAGQTEESTRRCREALEALSAIPADSPTYERAQAFVAEAHRRLGDADQAARLAEAWLAEKRPEPVGTGAKRARDQARAQALVTLLAAKTDRAAAAVGPAERTAAFRDVLDELARREVEFAALVPQGAEQIGAWRAEALLATGDLDAAEPIVLEQIRLRPSRAGTRYLAVAAARAFEDAALRARERRANAEERAHWLRAARLWEFASHADGATDPDAMRAAGVAFRAGGDLAHAVDLMSVAAGVLRGASASERDAAARARLAESARAVAVELARTLVLLGRFDEAETEAQSLLMQDDASGADALARLGAGDSLRGADVEWLVRRAAKSRAAVDVLASAFAGAGTRERFAAASQTLAALRYVLPRDAAPTAESVDLALRHADALLRHAAAGGPRDSALAAGSVLDESFGSDEALALAESLLPGAKARAVELKKRAAEAATR
jgi:hypothetical protein